VVAELQERLSKPAKTDMEIRVPQVLAKICQLENLVKYVYSPPKMVKACNELIAQHRGEITDSLIDHFDENPKVTANELEADICFKISKSCEGIKESPDAKVSETVVADQMLDSSSGQNIILQEIDGKIVPQVQEEAETNSDKKKEPKKDKKDKKKESDEKPDKKKKSEKKEKHEKKSHEKTEL